MSGQNAGVTQRNRSGGQSKLPATSSSDPEPEPEFQDETGSNVGMIQFLSKIFDKGIQLLIVLGFICPGIFIGSFVLAGRAEGLLTKMFSTINL